MFEIKQWYLSEQLCKNTFPRCGNTDQKTSPKTAALRCRANQTERKRQLAKLASKEAGRTHLAAETTAERREEKRRQANKLWKNTLLIYIKEHQRQHTRRTATPRTDPPPSPGAKPPPPPPPKGPTKTQTDQRQILAWVLDQCHGTQTTLKVRFTCQ